MDWTSWISFLVMLINIPVYIAAEQMELNMTLDIWEGNVTVLWHPPKGAPINAYYQVQQAPYSQRKEWEIVQECNLTTETRCELGNFINKNMKIKIGLLKANGNFSWSAGRRIRLLGSKLLAPEFDLSSSPNTVKVKIYRKTFLEEFYEYGLSYSVILYPKGHENEALVSVDDDDDGEVEFTSLSIWQEYCVRVKVETIADNVSNTSLARCIYPSADSSLVISIAVIGVVGVTSFFMFAVCFFLRRPGKMPGVLKSAVNGWNPMNVGLIQVETVTDKGWLLTSNKTAGKSKAFDESKDLLEEDKERRESTDSGVSVSQQHSIKNRGTDEQIGQEDSGCGSLTSTEDSLSSGRRSLEELPFLDGGINSSSESERKEDSGLGMGNQEASDNLSGMDGDLLSEIIVGDGYRSQSPSADTESEATIPCEAVASGGYRSGHVTCLCSDVETCMWCKTRKLLTDSDLLSHEQTSCTFTTGNDNDKPSYLKKSPLQSVNVLGREDLSEDCDESSLFITCPLLLQEPCQLDTFSLKLGDIELTFT